MKRSKPINSSDASSGKPPPRRRKRQTAGGLEALQRLMATAVMRRLGRGDVMQRTWLDGRRADRVAARFIKPNDRLSSFERLEIYNQQYWFRLRDCLRKDYPGVRAVLGGEEFGRMTEKYLGRHPSQSYTLRDLGRLLAEFLEAGPRRAARPVGLAADVARLEWAHLQAFDAEAKPSLRLEDLADANAATIRLRLQPHLTLLKLRYEADKFLLKLKGTAGLRAEASNAVESRARESHRRPVPRPRRNNIFLAVHRFEGRVYYKRLEAGEFEVLSAIERGATLADACSALAGLDLPGNPATTIREWFASWAALGWFWSAKR